MPVREEASERRLLGGLDLAPQRSKRGAPQPAQHVGIAPLALDASWTKLAAHELLRVLELAQVRLDVDAEPRVRLRGRERPAAAREAHHELLE